MWMKNGERCYTRWLVKDHAYRLKPTARTRSRPFSTPERYCDADHYPRVLKDTPRFAAITLVAPGERFDTLAILVTPCLSLAIVFNMRTSSFDHARLTNFFLA